MYKRQGIDRTAHDTVDKHQLAAPLQRKFLNAFHVHLELLPVELIGFRHRHAFIIGPVSYTHLDVYKRQLLYLILRPAVCRRVAVSSARHIDDGENSALEEHIAV